MAPLPNSLLVGIAVVIFLAVLMFAQFVYWTMQDRRAADSRELSRRLGTLAEKPQASLFRVRAAPDRGGVVGRVDVLLRRAGSPYPASTVYTRMMIGATAGAVLGITLTRGGLGLALAPIGAAVPVLLLYSAAADRAARLTSQLPDGLDLIARSLQAGHGIAEAFRLVAEEAPLPLAQEFGRVYDENNLGRDFRECLLNLNRRNPDNFDLQIFVSAVLLQRDTGGNLVEILGSIATTIRARYTFQGKVRALTSEARLTAFILCALPFLIALAISRVSPGYLTPLIHDPLGIAMVLYALVSFCIGVVTMREIAQVES